jgi:hypothetical protein
MSFRGGASSGPDCLKRRLPVLSAVGAFTTRREWLLAVLQFGRTE